MVDNGDGVSDLVADICRRIGYVFWIERRQLGDPTFDVNSVFVEASSLGGWIQDSMGWSCYRHLRDSKVRIDKKRKNKATLIK